MRLNKFIAQSGVCSRRKADDLIIAGKVKVNGVDVTELGINVSELDQVKVNGKEISLAEKKIVLAMNKPRGVTTTLSDPYAEKTVKDILPKKYKHLFPAGRLDRESKGLLILTNDGDLAQQLTHPSYEHEKEYVVQVAKPLSDRDLHKLAGGIVLKEGQTDPAEVDRLGEKMFSIVLHQGWKRQIRRMVEAIGNHVTMLKRVRIGKLELEDLQPGEVREVDISDII